MKFLADSGPEFRGRGQVLVPDLVHGHHPVHQHAQDGLLPREPGFGHQDPRVLGPLPGRQAELEAQVHHGLPPGPRRLMTPIMNGGDSGHVGG